MRQLAGKLDSNCCSLQLFYFFCWRLRLFGEHPVTSKVGHAPRDTMFASDNKDLPQDSERFAIHRGKGFKYDLESGQQHGMSNPCAGWQSGCALISSHMNLQCSRQRRLASSNARGGRDRRQSLTALDHVLPRT